VRRVAAILIVAVPLAAAGCSVGGEETREPAQGPAAQATPEPSPGTAPRLRPPLKRLTVSVSGDLLPHLPIVQRAATGGGSYDFAPMLRPLRPLIRRADLALCHVETPLTSAAPAGYPVFSSPPALARAIEATGWDACSTASNHALDRGEAGIAATIRSLRRAGLRHTGTATSARGRNRPLILRARGLRIGFLSYTATTNGFVPPHPWSVNLARAGLIRRDARAARRAGAQAVIVNLHWGTEYVAGPDARQRALAVRLARSRAITAMVGQHAHVVQPIRRVRGRWVVFGSGNLLSNQTAACCTAATQDGMVVRLHLRVRGRRARVERITYAPTWVRHPDFKVLPVGRALRRGQADRALLRASWRRTVGVVGRRRGLRPVPPRLP